MFEIYRDKESQQENGQAPWFFEYLQKFQSLLAGMTEVMTGTPEWAKGISVWPFVTGDSGQSCTIGHDCPDLC